MYNIYQKKYVVICWLFFIKNPIIKSSIMICIMKLYYVCNLADIIQANIASYQAASQMIDIGLQMQNVLYNKKKLPIDGNPFLMCKDNKDNNDDDEDNCPEWSKGLLKSRCSNKLCFSVSSHAVAILHKDHMCCKCFTSLRTYNGSPFPSCNEKDKDYGYDEDNKKYKDNNDDVIEEYRMSSQNERFEIKISLTKFV